MDLRPLTCRVVTYLLVMAAAARIGFIAWADPHFVDFRCFQAATEAMAGGLDPFVLENLSWSQWNTAPLVYPGLFVFFLPFVPMAAVWGAYVFFALNVAAGVALYGLIVRASGLCARFSLRTPCNQTMMVTAGAFFFVNSIFFTLCIRVGQVSIWAALFFMLTLLVKGERRRTFFMGAAAAIKYSNIPFLALALLGKGHMRRCAVAFCWFVALSLLPCAFGQSPISLYQSYWRNLTEWMQPGGGNSFAVSGQTMVSLGFFKSVVARATISMLIVGFFVAVLWRDRNKTRDLVNVHVIFAIACVTMLLVYHRIYDAVLVYPPLLIEIVVLRQQGRRTLSAMAAGFAAAFALPGAWWEFAGRALGARLGENTFIFLPDNSVPLPAMAFLLLTAFSLYVALTRTPVLMNQIGVGEINPQ